MRSRLSDRHIAAKPNRACSCSAPCPHGARAGDAWIDKQQSGTGDPDLLLLWRTESRWDTCNPGTRSLGKHDGMTLILSVLYVLLASLCAITSAASDYHERLVLQPLPSSSLLASFNFRSNASIVSFEKQHFRYFPRSLGQILQHAHTKELHLRFTTGRWDAESWGTRPWNGSKEGGTGVEIWAWIDAPSDDEYVVPSRQRGLGY